MKEYTAAIVEDDQENLRELETLLARYGEEHSCAFHVRSFAHGEAFLEGFRPVYDLVFLDIELGQGWMNGMTAAEELRKRDGMVPLFFITNMPQYAPLGYAVDATDYILKPVNYHSLSVKLSKTLRLLADRSGVPVRVRDENGLRIISSADINYIEVTGHALLFHTAEGVIRSYGGLSEREAELKDRDFARVSASVLVNLRRVTGLYGEEISAGGDRIRIGRTKKKEFMARLNQYLGG